jgi:hypothetical protein
MGELRTLFQATHRLQLINLLPVRKAFGRVQKKMTRLAVQLPCALKVLSRCWLPQGSNSLQRMLPLQSCLLLEQEMHKRMDEFKCECDGEKSCGSNYTALLSDVLKRSTLPQKNQQESDRRSIHCLL